MGLNLYLHNATPEFEEALIEYKKLLNFNFDLIPLKSESKIKLRSLGYIISYNHQPENLDLLRNIKEIKKNEFICFLPILFVSPPLSKAGMDIYGELDLIWHTFLPFDANDFFNQLLTLTRYGKESFEIVRNRQKIQFLYKNKKYQEAIDLCYTLENTSLNQFFVYLFLTILIRF